ncbi:MAG: hypothetical protein IJC61_02645 [Oscillospiraceae bacterium]|nr:hypothetical protein [Oscillospiraceae bacterium]MBQ9959246.1 hypothetical protein [Oscillospiraceae bacterium]
MLNEVEQLQIWELFESTESASDTAKLYAEIRVLLDNVMDVRMEELIRDSVENRRILQAIKESEA